MSMTGKQQGRVVRALAVGFMKPMSNKERHILESSEDINLVIFPSQSTAGLIKVSEQRDDYLVV